MVFIFPYLILLIDINYFYIDKPSAAQKAAKPMLTKKSHRVKIADRPNLRSLTSATTLKKSAMQPDNNNECVLSDSTELQ